MIFQSEQPTIHDYMESIKEQMDDYPSTMDQDDIIHQIIDNEVNTMWNSTMDNILNEYGIHYAYEEYYSEYGSFPDSPRPVIYRILYEMLTNIYLE